MFFRATPKDTFEPHEFDAAAFVLTALQWYKKQDDVTVELEEMETESVELPKEEGYSMRKLLRTHALHMPLLIAIMLQVIQQLSGINAVSTRPRWATLNSPKCLTDVSTKQCEVFKTRNQSFLSRGAARATFDSLPVKINSQRFLFRRGIVPLSL